MMKPLYKFILDEDTGKIFAREITEYDSGKWLADTGYLRYKENGFRKYVYLDKMDKYLSGHVYSFNPDILHAKSIIMNNVKIRRAKAKREYERWNGVFEKLRRN